MDSTITAASVEPLPPHATEAEQALLGACITDPVGVLPVASTLLEARDFYHPQNAEIFNALCAFNGGGIPDFVLLCDELDRRGSLARVGGIPYLTKLIQTGALAPHVERYCQAIYAASFRRAMIQACGMIARVTYQSQSDVPSTLECALAEIEQVKARFAVDRAARKHGPTPTWKRPDR